MSKSAIKYLTAANEILAALDLTIGNPASWMTNEQARGQFKNADLLACLIIDSAANALICENVDTLDDTMYDDMQQAVEGYISANLDDWNQAEWKANASLCDVKALLAKLLDAVEGQRAYEAASKFMKGIDGAWKGIVYPRVRVTAASRIVYEASLCHVDIDDSSGEERMFSFWYIPAIKRCKYAAIIPETVEYIS